MSLMSLMSLSCLTLLPLDDGIMSASSAHRSRQPHVVPFYSSSWLTTSCAALCSARAHLAKTVPLGASEQALCWIAIVIIIGTIIGTSY